MEKKLKIDNAIENFAGIQKEITRLEIRALSIVREHLDSKANPHWHKLIIKAIAEMENDFGDLEEEAEEQEEAALSEEVLGFCQKNPKVKPSEDIKKMTEEEHRELKLLKEYNKYLNDDGMEQLADLWSRADVESGAQLKLND